MANAALRQRIRSSKAMQQAYWNTIDKAATLAAGQVRDKRIDELEKPKGVSMLGVIVDILFAVAIGPAAGMAIEMLFTKMITPVLRSRGVLFDLTERSLEVEQVVTADGIAAARRFFQKDRSLKLTQTSDDRKVLRDGATKLLTSAVGVGLDQVKRKAKASSPPATTTRSVGGDSPAIMIETYVSHIVTEQIAAVDLTHSQLEMAVEDASPTDALVLQMTGLFDDNQQDQAKLPDLDTALELYKRFWEACIWVCLFDVDHLRRRHYVMKKYYGDEFPWPEGFEWSAPDSLVEYWYARFPHDGYGSTGSFNDLEKWVDDQRALKKSYGLSDKYVDANYPRLDKGAELIKYFQTIERAIQSGARDFGVQDALVK